MIVKTKKNVDVGSLPLRYLRRSRFLDILLTGEIQATAWGPSGKIDQNAGYQYRRLMENVVTGIYECNSQCSCRKTCLNRVAQRPLHLRLQVKLIFLTIALSNSKPLHIFFYFRYSGPKNEVGASAVLMTFQRVSLFVYTLGSC